MMTDEELDGLRTLLSVAPGSMDLMEVAKILLAHIDSQAAQIAALKEITIHERTERNIKDKGRFGFVLDPQTVDPRELARKQLEAEYEAMRK